MLKITPAASDQIRAQADNDEVKGLALRVAAMPDTKGGVNYAFGFDEPRETDTVIRADGYTVVISPDSEELLEGATLDYVEMEPGDFRFIFMNPNDPNYKAPTEA